MFDLTPGERRGALLLLALCALGAVWDLVRPAGSAPPAPGTAGPPAAARGPAAAPSAPLDLNTAAAADLDRLPGIGPVLARRIVEQRERAGRFRSPDELRAVKGIGPRLLERLRPLVRAGGTAVDTVRNALPARR